MAFIIRNRLKKEAEEEEEQLQDNVHFMGRQTKHRTNRHTRHTVAEPMEEPLDAGLFGATCVRKSYIPTFDKDFPHRRLGVLVENDEVIISSIELPLGRKRALLYSCCAPLQASAPAAPPHKRWFRFVRPRSRDPESGVVKPPTVISARLLALRSRKGANLLYRLKNALRRRGRGLPTPTSVYAAVRAKLGRPSVAQLDHKLKDALVSKEFPEFSKYVIGQFVDALARHVLVLEDLRAISLQAQMAEFTGCEEDIVWKVLQPLLLSIAKLHRAGIAHRSLSPSHVFRASGEHGSGNVYATLPCPACSPHRLNRILLDQVPDSYFPPELWVRILQTLPYFA